MFVSLFSFKKRRYYDRFNMLLPCWDYFSVGVLGGDIVIRQERMGSNAPGGGGHLSSGDRREGRTHGSARGEQGETWERHVLT